MVDPDVYPTEDPPVTLDEFDPAADTAPVGRDEACDGSGEG